MQTTEVTQGQWETIMGKNPSGFVECGKKCPVEGVSWDDIQLFLEKIHKKEDREYRLPTTSEWEYACRAGSKTLYFFGDDPKLLSEHAWFNGNSDGKPHPVGQTHPNSWGLFDMHGNVWEWCRDRYQSYPVNPVKDPVAPFEGGYRGGSWDANPHKCRSASSDAAYTGARYNDLGFRLVVDRP